MSGQQQDRVVLCKRIRKIPKREGADQSGPVPVDEDLRRPAWRVPDDPAKRIDELLLWNWGSQNVAHAA